MEGLNITNWEIVTGCERLTPGCDSCPSYWYSQNNGLDYSVKTHLEKLSIPENDILPKTYSVAHGSDLFHESVSIDELKKIFRKMNKARHHNFEIVTKRIERAFCIANQLDWSKNISLGVAVESGEYRWRVDYLRKIPANYKFLSVCPILGPFPKIDLNGIDHVGIVPETWGLKRPVKSEWVDDLIEQCKKQKVSYTVNDFYLWGVN